MIHELAGAKFSECGTYRYYLWRIWDKSKPLVMFVGLNPSTANAKKNDKTISKVCKIARFNGYGGIYMYNLYAIISPDPEVLLTCRDSMGENHFHFKEVYSKCKDVVFCWGSFKEAEKMSPAMIESVPAPLCIIQNKNGSPKHPLYCKDESKLIDFITKTNKNDSAVASNRN